jgi:secreted trypsin-like serine protease
MIFFKSIATIENRISRHLQRVCAITLLAPSLAFAIIGGEGVDPNTASSPWAGVGSVLTSNGTFSGTLIAPNYVLTAAHVVAGIAGNPSAVTFQMNAGASVQIAAQQIFVNPGYTGVAASDGIVHNDLAIIRLGDLAPAGVPYYSLYSPAVTTGTTLKLVGYGTGGDGLTGATILNDPTVKRTGENKADILLPYGATHDVFMYDFDGPSFASNAFGANVAANATLGANVEATVGSGDSGGAAFVFDNGTWKLAGVNTFTGSVGIGAPGFYGSIGGGMLLSAQSTWINSVVVPVPEPSSLAMLLAGLGLIGFAGSRSLFQV